MKVLIYLLFLTTTTLSLMSQRMQEPLVELSKPDYVIPSNMSMTRSSSTAFGCCRCVYQIWDENSSLKRLENIVQVTHVDMNAYRNFGILSPEWESVSENPYIMINNVSVRSDAKVYIDGVEIEPQIFVGKMRGQQPDVSTKSITKSTVKGTVIDKDGNPGIANVVISGENLKGGFTGVQTDEQGSFGIQVPPGNYKVKVSQQGHIDHFQDITVELDRNLNLGMIRLKEAPIELTTYAYYTDDLPNECVSIITITTGDIKRIPNCFCEYDHVEKTKVEYCDKCICAIILSTFQHSGIRSLEFT